MKKTLLLASIACLLSQNVYADENQGETLEPLVKDGKVNLYIGMNLGYANVKLDNNWDLLADEDYAAVDINIGSKFGKYFGVELFSESSSEQEKIDGLKTSFTGYGADLIGYVPFTEKLEGLASVGIAHYKVKAELNEKINGAKYSLSESDDKTAPKFGLGLQYNFNENWAMRTMFNYVNLSMDSVKSIAEAKIGVKYSF